MNITLFLGASYFGVTTTGVAKSDGNFSSEGLAYINRGPTTFDKVVFTAVGHKAVATIDNLTFNSAAASEASDSVLLGIGGVTFILRRLE